MRAPGNWSIGLRLTAWYSLVLLFALVLFGFAMWFAVRQSLLSSLDDMLRSHVEGAVRLLQAEIEEGASSRALRDELEEYARAVPEGNLIEVRAANRVILPASSPAGASAAQRWFRRVETIGGQRFDISSSASLAEVNAVLGRFKIFLLAAIPVVLLIASGGGYWLSRRALRPVDEITAAAQTIGIRNLSLRLPVPRTGDALARLSTTWNDTLGRLDLAVTRLTQFTADASHELRTPITLVRTAAELALRRERTPEEYRGALEQIRHESERMSELIENLLLLARADAGLDALPLRPVDLSAITRSVCGDCRALAESRQLTIDCEAPPGPVYLEGNEPALRRLLLVLLDNALHYTPAGGRIHVGLSANGVGTQLEVRDTGRGIDPAALPHIFERFYRADPSRNRGDGHSGLGLAIAEWIAARHGAQIQVESAPGQGAVFTVKFPAGP